VGTLIQQVAAERHCPVTLELGGKSPQIIFADADLGAAMPVVINAIVQNAGPDLLRRLARADGAEHLRAAARAPRPCLRSAARRPGGDGPGRRAADPPDQQQRVWDFLSDAQIAGIPMVATGVVVDEAPETGFYQAPTLLRDVPVDHRLAQEEVFGPVLAAMPFRDEDEAVELANATQFGLVAGIWTNDGARQFRMAKRVKSGQVFINNYGAGGGVELPFGGVKSSGYGREKGSRRSTVSPRSRRSPSSTADQTHHIPTETESMRVKDKSIIVTGAGGGIGEGIAKRLAAEGAQVVVNDINTALGEQVVEAILRAGGRASFFAADVTKSAEVKALVDAAIERHGKLDAMVNNAGWTHRNRPALEVSEDEFDRCYSVNVKSIYLSTIHAVPAFRANGGGSFINIASTAGVRPRPGLTWYNGSKGAVITTSKSLAAELGPDNIRVNCINPVFNPGHRPRCRNSPADRSPMERKSQVPSPPFRWTFLDRARRCHMRALVTSRATRRRHQRRLHRGRRRALRVADAAGVM
jgi:3-oxoacyl-[acyl-carrier protein] reductase